MRTTSFLCLFLAAYICAADPPKSDWPLTPTQPEPPKPKVEPVDILPAGRLYVVTHNGAPAQMLVSPPASAHVKEFAGKVVIDGYFVDGKEPETRVYEAKQVFLVKRVQPGKLELLKAPAGPVERRLLSDTGPEPAPEPTPKPPTPEPPVPEPIKPVIAIDGTSVLLLYESADLPKYPKEWVALPYSTKLYSYLDSVCADHPSGKGKAWRIWDKDDAGHLDSIAFGDAQKRPRTAIPWAIISSRNGNYEGPWPKDTDAMIDLIKKTTGGK